MPSDYRVSQALSVRFLGGFLVLVGVLVVGTALLVHVFDLSVAVLSTVVLLGAVSVVAVGFLVTRRAVVVRLDDIGYQVRFLRKAGVKQARWADVEDVVSGFASEQPVVVIRLVDGRTTTIPVNLLAGSSEDFAKDVGRHAASGRKRR